MNEFETLHGFTAGKTAMQAARIKKILTAPIRFADMQEIHNEQEAMEYAIKNNMNVTEKTTIRPKLLAIKSERIPKQWEYVKREEGLKERDFGAFVRGTADTPLTNYLRNGDSSKLPEKYKSMEYRLYTGDSIYVKISKTAYKYYQYLKTL